MTHRIAQVNELLRQEINQLFLTEVDFPLNCLVTITRVETSKDLRHAKVLISVMPVMYIPKVLVKLKTNASHLQYLLRKKLTMKPLPALNFRIDDTEQKAAEIEELLDQIKKES